MASNLTSGLRKFDDCFGPKPGLVMTRIAVLPELDATHYQRSELHADSCIWLEKNCYIDIWIEVLHALKLNPIAMLPFTLAIDFEGDQWTFFKPVHSELRELYGVDVQELNVWRPLIEHAVEHLSAGKLISTEADAFWLPDTAGTDYQRTHTKTTIVLADIDVDNRRLGYFHNAGYHSLSGEDFARTFRLDMPADPTFMPLFAETIRFDRKIHRSASELAQVSLGFLRTHFQMRPVSNPITRFKSRFERDLPAIQTHGLGFYHAWAFGTIRQLGAAAELISTYLTWLEAQEGSDVGAAAQAFRNVAAANKTMILKAARAVNSKRAFDFSTFDEMEASWNSGMQSVQLALDRHAQSHRSGI